MEPISTEPILILELDLDSRPDEDLLVQAWRAEQLRRLGLTGPLSVVLAEQVDWHELADLLGRGCPLDLALEIIR
jgi:hypothetical protein